MNPLVCRSTSLAGVIFPRAHSPIPEPIDGGVRFDDAINDGAVNDDNLNPARARNC